MSLKHSLLKQSTKVFNAILIFTLRHNIVTLGDKKSQTSDKRHKNVNLGYKKPQASEKRHKNVNLGDKKSQTSEKRSQKVTD